MALDKYLMGEMTGPELKQTVGEGRIAVLPAGCIEQHGPHLPLDTDIFIADEISRRAGALVPDRVVVVPPIVHGHSPHHMDFPGTLTVSPINMINYVLDICLSLARHGFTKVLIVTLRSGQSHAASWTTQMATHYVGVQWLRPSQKVAPCKEHPTCFTPRRTSARQPATYPTVQVRPPKRILCRPKPHIACIIAHLFNIFKVRCVLAKAAARNPPNRSPSRAATCGKFYSVEGLAQIFVDLHERAIPPRVDHH